MFEAVDIAVQFPFFHFQHSPFTGADMAIIHFCAAHIAVQAAVFMTELGGFTGSKRAIVYTLGNPRAGMAFMQALCFSVSNRQGKE